MYDESRPASAGRHIGTRAVGLLAVLASALSLAFGQIHFVERPLQELGIDEIAASPVFVDYNSDGLVDFWAGLAYLNNGNGTFTKLPLSRWGGGECVCFGDYDNDGYPDILTNCVKNDTIKVRIYHNDGPPDFTVTEVTDAVKIGIPIFERDLVDAVWLDYDNDSWLDCYVSSYEYPFPTGHEDYLFHNVNGDSFVDVSASSGVAGVALCSRGVSVSDFDEDGDADVFVSVYRLEPNLLWQNNGDGTFTDVAGEKGVKGLFIQGYYGHNIGAQWGDYNNDGHQDLMSPITHHAGYPGDSTGHLWLSDGPPDYTFTCCWPGAGMTNTEIGSAPNAGDYDNDGDLDLYWVNLYGQPTADGWLYRNNGDTTFTNVNVEAGINYPGDLRNYMIFVDYNGDGYLDISWPRVAGGVTEYEFLENSGGNGNHWVEVALTGTRSNRSGIGARIDVFCGSWRAVRECFHNGGHGYGSPFVPLQHIGLGPYAVMDSLVISWPSGTRDVYRNQAGDRVMHCTEGVLAVEDRPAAQPAVGPVLTAASERGRVRLRLSGWNQTDPPVCRIYDRLGRFAGEVRTWKAHADVSEATWDGGRMPSGVYFAAIETKTGRVSAKALLLREEGR